MTRDERQLYARQVLLPQIGQSGQRALCAASFRAPATPAGAVATDYLVRAGATADSGEPLPIPEIRATETTRPAAAALAGALAASRFIAETVGLQWPDDASPVVLG